MRIFKALPLCLALAGCGVGSGVLPDFMAPDPVDARVTELDLMVGGLKAVAPEGFCFDRRSSQPSRGFGLLVRCDRLLGKELRFGADAVITVQAGKAGSAVVEADPDAFARYLQSGAGHGHLSAAGDAATVSNLSTRVAARRSVMARYVDRAALAAKASTSVVRSFSDIDGRLVTVSVRGNGGRSLDASQAESLAADTVVAMRDANG